MKVPELRFTKYDEDWLTTTIGDVSRVTSGGTPSRTNNSYWGGHIPWVTTSLIDFGTILHAEEFITDEGLKNSSAKLFPKGTLLIALYGQGVTRGKVSLLGIDATTNQACAAMIFDEEKVLPIFALFQLMSKYEAIRNLANDGGQKNLSGGLVKSLGVALPNLEEQQKIADFLTSVDKKISLLKDKRVLLIQYKKGVMQKLFKQEIRFKDDNGKAFPDWQEEKLGNHLEEYKEKSKKENQFEVLTSSRTGLMKQSDYYGEGRITERANKGFNVIPNAYLTYRSRSDDRQFFFNLNELGFTGIISTYYPVFKMKNNQNKFFVELSRFHKNRFGRQAVGTSQVVLSFNEVKSIKFPMPSTEEQSKISAFLNSIDKKLEAVNEQIELTQTFKKGLLQQMFV